MNCEPQKTIRVLRKRLIVQIAAMTAWAVVAKTGRVMVKAGRLPLGLKPAAGIKATVNRMGVSRNFCGENPKTCRAF